MKKILLKLLLTATVSVLVIAGVFALTGGVAHATASGQTTDFGDSDGVSELPSNWISKITDFRIIDSRSELEEITFAETAPEGYTDSGKALNTDMKIYTKEDDGVKIAFVLDGTIAAPQNAEGLFSDLINLKSINFGNFSTEGVTDMSSMFSFCHSLTSLDLSCFNTASVTDMEFMFCSCNSITSLDLSCFDTASVTNMSNMFYLCNNLESIDLSGFNTERVTDMVYMFGGCNKLASLDLSSFTTSGVTVMRCMFDGCGSLTSLDLSVFEIANDAIVNYMFDRCNSLNEIQTPKSVGTALPLPCNYWNGDPARGLIDEITSADAIKTIYRHADHAEKTAATCTAKAVCSICGQGYGELAAHTLTGVAQIDKTCTTDGVLAHDSCSVCGKNFIDGIEKSAEELKISALGHIEVSDGNAKAPSCEGTGLTESKHCSACEAVLEEQTIISALGHDYGDWTVVKEASETEEGEERRVCANDETHFESRPLPKVANDNIGVSEPASDGLSVGAIAGIITGVLIFLLLLLYVISYFALYRREILLKGKFFDVLFIPMNAIFGKKEYEEEVENS